MQVKNTFGHADFLEGSEKWLKSFVQMKERKDYVGSRSQMTILLQY
jgi:hypothetical protein